jgi:hypothetical protein
MILKALPFLGIPKTNGFEDKRFNQLMSGLSW